MIRSKLTVYFEDPFWVGLFEFQVDENYYIARRVFGAEPTDPEVFLLLLRHKPEYRLPMKAETLPEPETGVKRRQRQASKELAARGPGRKALDAIKLQRETRKKESALESSKKKKEESEADYLLKREKRKGKHRGH